jgi:hypothetical protein
VDLSLPSERVGQRRFFFPVGFFAGRRARSRDAFSFDAARVAERGRAFAFTFCFGDDGRGRAAGFAEGFAAGFGAGAGAARGGGGGGAGRAAAAAATGATGPGWRPGGGATGRGGASGRPPTGTAGRGGAARDSFASRASSSSRVTTSGP